MIYIGLVTLVMKHKQYSSTTCLTSIFIRVLHNTQKEISDAKLHIWTLIKKNKKKNYILGLASVTSNFEAF